MISKPTRPRIVTLIAVVVVLLAAEAGARVVEPRVADPASRWGQSQIDEKVAQMQALAETGGADVVFLGSSVVNVGVDPDAFAAQSSWADRAYNAAVSSGTPIMLERWAEEVVLPLLDPEVVVIGLTSLALNDNGSAQRAAYRRYVGSLGRADFLGAASRSQRLKLAADDWSGIYRLRDELRSPYSFLARLKSGLPDTPVLGDSGQDLRRLDRVYEVPDEFRTDQMELVLADYEIGGEQLAALERLIGAAQRRGATVYVVAMPIVEDDYIPLHPNGDEDFQEWIAAFEGMAADDTIRTLNGFGIAADRVLYADPLHVNAEGSAWVTSWLAEAIAP